MIRDEIYRKALGQSGRFLKGARATSSGIGGGRLCETRKGGRTSSLRMGGGLGCLKGTTVLDNGATSVDIGGGGR